MKQITAINAQTTAVYRFDGKDIYIKVNNLATAQTLIKQIIEKGGRIQQGRKWIRANIFGDNTYIKMGGLIMDLTILTHKEIEEKLFDFFKTFLESSGFKCEVSDI